MLVRRTRTLVLSCALVMGVLAGTAGPSPAGTATHWHPAARVDTRKLGIPVPVGTVGPNVGQATIRWSTVKGANRYLVPWSLAPYGMAPGSPTYVGNRWLPGTYRSATLPVGGLGSRMLSLPYGNPVYFDLWADNSRDKAPRHKSHWIAVYPRIATPANGTPVTVGTYNILGGRDVAGVAANIREHALGVVALQEASLGQTDAGGAVSRALGWSTTGDGLESQIVYDRSLLTLGRHGSVNVTNFKSGGSLVVPYAQFTPTSGGLPFWVSSAHFVVGGGSQAQRNVQTGQDAQQLATALDGIVGKDPVVVAGDFTSNREPFGDTHPAQPTLVRNGYWDSMASLSRVGYQYSTFNGLRHQPAGSSGVGTRADYILVRGIHGSYQSVNVANWHGGTPSDHNLVYTRLRVP